MLPGDRVTVRVEKAVAGARMLARHEGAVVLVADAIPGEVVEVEIEKVQRGTAWAVTRTVLDPSPDRVQPCCEWACGGSAYAHVRYERQLDLKRDVLRDAFARIARLPLEGDTHVVPSRCDGYRMRARLHVRGKRVGFFREGTHELCDAASTRQLLPATIEALGALERGIAETDARIRAIAVAENCEATERAVHLELAEDADPSRLAEVVRNASITGASCSAGPRRRPLTISGSPIVTDTVAGVRLSRHGHAFFQGNRYLLSDLVSTVCRQVPAGRVVDLYAGVGLFSAALAARGDEVIAVEGDAVAAEDLKHNLAVHRVAGRARHQSVEAFLANRGTNLQGASVIVDPPRTGMSKEALAATLALRPVRLVYVSCDVATLARDVRAAVERGFELASLTIFDMFPNTAHLETVAVLTSGAY
jgi:23S rRNA (uracil1939-C5)-methyltransferase